MEDFTKTRMGKLTIAFIVSGFAAFFASGTIIYGVFNFVLFPIVGIGGGWRPYLSMVMAAWVPWFFVAIGYRYFDNG